MGDPIKKTESSFQPSVFKCRKINKFQEVLVTAIPDLSSHTAGKLLDILKCNLVFHQVRRPNSGGIVKMWSNQRKV